MDEPSDAMSRRREAMSLASIGIVLVVVMGASTILWAHQSPDSAFHVGSRGAAGALVAFWAAPTIVLFVRWARNWAFVAIGGLAVIVMQTWCWWIASTDEHSTASLGPGFVGWFFGPLILLVIRMVTSANFAARVRQIWRRVRR